MKLRRIEITEPVLKIGLVTYYSGDVKSFPAAEADEYVRLGWAKDPETGESAERQPGARFLNVQAIQQRVD